jgi:AraC-like DNA-binding protein
MNWHIVATLCVPVGIAGYAFASGNNYKNFDVATYAIGVSERRLSQVFREEVGIAPRLWCRIRRFQAATRAMHAGVEVRWAELALNCGYYDQSHFANDFRAFSGLDATAYSKHKSRWQNHVSLD